MAEQTNLSTTPLHAYHEANAKAMEPFGGFLMPMQYAGKERGVIKEHLATRSGTGVFDVSHMGRLLISGDGALSYLQNVTTNNVSLLGIGDAQYTFIQNEDGCALDDAYLYRTNDQEYMLVVNAGNTLQDIAWLREHQPRDASLDNITEELAMISLQGPDSPEVFAKAAEELGIEGRIGKGRNTYDVMGYNGSELFAARTGYTGEPRGNEFFVRPEDAPEFWEVLIEQGAVPVGLGARDTLRLEAGLPLYGHELTPKDPILSVAVGKIGVSFAPEKGNYMGRLALLVQAAEREDIRLQGANYGVPLDDRVLKTIVRPMAGMNDDLTAPSRKPLREDYIVLHRGQKIGTITSGTTVPSYRMSSQDVYAEHTEDVISRPIALARLRSDFFPSKPIPKRKRYDVQDSRGRGSKAIIVSSNIGATTRYTHPVIHPEKFKPIPTVDRSKIPGNKLADLTQRAYANHKYRSELAVNLIPSESQVSKGVEKLSALGAGRYAEHRHIKAFGRDSPDVAYYGGSKFPIEVEHQLQAEFAELFGARRVEVRPISGQQSNMVIFGAMVDYLSRARVKGEDLVRMNSVMASSLAEGGHLSQQDFGGTKGSISVDPNTGRPGTHSFVSLPHNPFRVDVPKTLDKIVEVKPQLIIFGRSVMPYPEPVAEIAEFTAQLDQPPIIMYDGSHVNGLIPDFQNPLAEGAHFLSGSTHKTLPGTQRGFIATTIGPEQRLDSLWAKVLNRMLPGATSNHHPGTLLGLLAAHYEMEKHGDDYKTQVMANAKSFATALDDLGLDVFSDPELGFTQSHQVLLRVGNGPDIEARLGENNIITNYQAGPGDGGFADASYIRLGTQEMTRFGMVESDFQELAVLMKSAIDGQNVGAEVSRFRGNFTVMQYCCSIDELLAMLGDNEIFI